MIRTTILKTIVVAALIAGAPLQAFAQQAFDTPDAAGKLLVEAARKAEPGTLERIFGPGAKDVLSSGDPAVDAVRLADFLALAEKGTSVADGSEGRKELVFGANGWRFPIPLQKKDGGWTFDLAAGRQAIVDRRVGLNEVSAIGVCADFVAAQNEYRLSLHDDEPVPQYARRILSSPGRRDGLYWPPDGGADRSPLGDRIATAVDEGGNGRPRSYRGYTFRILTAQGRNAPGGAYDYMVRGRLLAGFAMIATPLAWGETGIMSFLCDQRGRIWERNLGENSARMAGKITRFDPGPGWNPVNLRN